MNWEAKEIMAVEYLVNVVIMKLVIIFYVCRMVYSLQRAFTKIVSDDSDTTL